MALKIVPLDNETMTSACKLLYKNWHRQYDSVLTQVQIQQKSFFHFQEYLENRKNNCWIACYGKRVAGVVAVTSNCIDELVVDTMYRRRKIGEQLVSVALHHFSELGFVSAQAGCESFNEQGQQFLQSLGWQLIASQAVDSHNGQTVDAMVFSIAVQSKMSRVS